MTRWQLKKARLEPRGASVMVAIAAGWAVSGRVKAASASGGREPSGGWGWTTGEPWVWTNWYPGEPGNSDGREDHLELIGRGHAEGHESLGKPGGLWLWNDNYGLNRQPFLVEFEPEEQAGLAAGAQPVDNPTNGHWYALIDERLPWEEARERAESIVWQGMHGYLATLTSAEETDWIQGNVPFPEGVTDFWIGGFQEGGPEPGGGC